MIILIGTNSVKFVEHASIIGNIHILSREAFCTMCIPSITSKYKKLLISKRKIGILKKLPKQGEDSESL